MTSTSFEHGYDAIRDRPSLRRFLAEVPAYPFLIWQHRTLVRNFFRREFYGRFRGSAFGVVWVLINPVFTFLTYYLVFGVMFQMRGGEDWHPAQYPLYLYAGIIAWAGFLETTAVSVGVVVENGNLIQKVSFPAQLLPLPLVAVNLIVFVVGALAYLAAALISGFDRPGPGLALLGLPLVLLVQALFTMGFSLFLAAAYVFLRDIRHIYPILANLWFFATPIFWYEEMFGKDSAMAGFMPILRLNPMYHLVEAHRLALGARDGGFAMLLQELGIAAVPSLLTFVFGYCFFRSLQHRFADEV